jgi:MoaA/NifB/PqqE/SkfB family radical SAM enzyme
MHLEDFQHFIDRNPRIRRLELANLGEALLNKHLPEMLAYAHERGVTTRLNQGVNLNHASEKVLEALVKCGTEVIRVSIDGISQTSYEQYRVGGRLERVLTHIRKINDWKAHYRSERPRLILQFIVFSHNEHELQGAELLARMLKMDFQARLNRRPQVFPIKDVESLRRRIGYADREEFHTTEGRHICHRNCLDLWKSPQINWDGKLLGCSRNKWVSLADNVFEADLDSLLNGEAMTYLRAVVTGQAPLREGVPCGHCEVYDYMRQSGNFVVPPQVDTFDLPLANEEMD